MVSYKQTAKQVQLLHLWGASHHTDKTCIKTIKGLGSTQMLYVI